MYVFVITPITEHTDEIINAQFSSAFISTPHFLRSHDKINMDVEIWKVLIHTRCPNSREPNI